MGENVTFEYANAYTEVFQVLKHMCKEDYEKIPTDVINMFETYCNKDYNFKYDARKEFEEQNLSKRAKLILAILFRDYWATKEQRMEIIEKQNYNRQKQEEEKRKIYNPDNIFKTNNIDNKVTNNTSIVEYKNSFFKKIINKIKSLFNK